MKAVAHNSFDVAYVMRRSFAALALSFLVVFGGTAEAGFASELSYSAPAPKPSYSASTPTAAPTLPVANGFSSSASPPAPTSTVTVKKVVASAVGGAIGAAPAAAMANSEAQQTATAPDEVSSNQRPSAALESTSKRAVAADQADIKVASTTATPMASVAAVAPAYGYTDPQPQHRSHDTGIFSPQVDNTHRNDYVPNPTPPTPLKAVAPQSQTDDGSPAFFWLVVSVVLLFLIGFILLSVWQNNGYRHTPAANTRKKSSTSTS